MNEFSYQPMSKDMSKAGSNFYAPEQSFTRPNPPVNNKSNSFSQPQEYDQWRSNSLPTSMAMSTPPVSANMTNYNNNNNNPATNPITCDLQEVIVYYQSQPELLRLILMSKVEEDKRRTEEAKLKAKELDMLLAQQQQQLTSSVPQTPDTSMMPTPTSMTSNNNINSMNNNNNNNNNYNTTNNLLNTNQFGQSPRRPSALEMLMDDTDCDRRDSALGSSFDGSPNSGELDDRAFSPTSSSAAASMLSLSFPSQPMMNVSAPRNSLHPLSPTYNMSQSLEESNNPFGSPMNMDDATTSPGQQQQQQQNAQRLDSCFPQRPRRRREMQAISKIVETRDYPYIDGFFWKNNGNTVQKKTGNKSVYYKCSNSSKGCPVNKTVTWRDNGEYLIKYRGEHLADCSKVQRIIDM